MIKFDRAFTEIFVNLFLTIEILDQFYTNFTKIFFCEMKR